ncbi:FecR domain-containing protein [Luteolibacter luteus]|uniref:Tetratricopeptide repeat protein n=1 Tax=Luteolibacter luteus TaxID=2728835 RepID=A0A858RLJ2_9BACT|nr:tetratricopeptide repeat protein [Luteolibacter luteus]QJE97249.1 tetratricopeptide repeat protein [Luteolibacter luteus]
MRYRVVFLSAFGAAVGTVCGQNAQVLEIENIVQASKGAHGAWTAAAKDQSLAVGDRVRTRQRSRATLKLTDLYTMRLEQFTTVEIAPGLFQETKPRLDVGSGAAFIFSREKGGEIDIKTPAANGAMRGTQLYVHVAANGTSRFHVLEGEVELANPQGKLVLAAGEAGEAAPGLAPRRTAMIMANNLLQWALYYPAVLDPSELGMTAGEQQAVAKSLAAYREGDLLAALERYPSREPQGSGGRLYQAAVLLAVGRLDEAERCLKGVPVDHSGRRALERMISAVKFREGEPWPDDRLQTTGEAMAESYYRQSRSDLKGARDAATIATRLAPENGYAWTRLAELEFSFGRTKESRAALASGLQFTPSNARAHALRGYVLSADNDIGEAEKAFQEAVRLDGALGSAWLGLGLTKTRRGDLAGGRADMQTASTVEPTGSIYHSYLGKALSMEGRKEEARKDLDLARSLDPRDPTPWLYSALELQQQNRPNEAIDDLNQSILLNDNRRVYRSQLLLDQDRAVRSANMARIYQNAGMQDVAVREATRAVENDYTNASAHLFLANSFDALRDPDRITLRYETPWFNELLLAYLLAPVGGGQLSQFVSQQEFSKMLESDGLGGSLLSEIRSDGETRTVASFFGTAGDFSFGLDAVYRDNNGGDRFNNDATRKEIYGQLKWQPTPDDIFYFLGKWQDQDGGDNFDTYSNLPVEPHLDFEETQEPGMLLGGWNHRWAPGVHTLFLGGHLSAEQVLVNPSSTQLLVQRDADGLRPGFIENVNGVDQFTDPNLQNADPPAVGLGPDGESLIYSGDLLRAIQPYLGRGAVLDVSGAPFAFYSRRNFEIDSAEIQQIYQTDRNLLIAGARWQSGEFETDTRLVAQRPNFNGGFETPAVQQHSVVDFDRLSFYGYDYWRVLPNLTLIGGASWDHIEHPDNFRNPPVNNLQRDDEEFSGKFGFTYTPTRWATFRGMYAGGLGGVSFDESVRLEPVQLAGFNQAYRTVISESITGSVEAPYYDIWGLSAEGSIPTRTYWGASVNVIQQEVDRTRGIFTGYDAGVFPSTPAYFADSMAEHLEYEERSLSLTLNQLIADQFSVGAGFRVTRSELDAALPELPASIAPFARMEDRATLYEVLLSANWNSPTGLFARLEANYFSQDLEDAPSRPYRSGDAFWQFNALAGYRFYDNQCEISAGVLNIGDTDYRLSALNPRQEIVRDRTAVVRCRFTF